MDIIFVHSVFAFIILKWSKIYLNSVNTYLSRTQISSKIVERAVRPFYYYCNTHYFWFCFMRTRFYVYMMCRFFLLIFKSSNKKRLCFNCCISAIKLITIFMCRIKESKYMREHNFMWIMRTQLYTIYTFHTSSFESVEHSTYTCMQGGKRYVA